MLPDHEALLQEAESRKNGTSLALVQWLSGNLYFLLEKQPDEVSAIRILQGVLTRVPVEGVIKKTRLFDPAKANKILLVTVPAEGEQVSTKENIAREVESLRQRAVLHSGSEVQVLSLAEAMELLKEKQNFAADDDAPAMIMMEGAAVADIEQLARRLNAYRKPGNEIPVVVSRPVFFAYDYGEDGLSQVLSRLKQDSFILSYFQKNRNRKSHLEMALEMVMLTNPPAFFDSGIQGHTEGVWAGLSNEARNYLWNYIRQNNFTGLSINGLLFLKELENAILNGRWKRPDTISLRPNGSTLDLAGPLWHFNEGRKMSLEEVRNYARFLKTQVQNPEGRVIKPGTETALKYIEDQDVETSNLGTLERIIGRALDILPGKDAAMADVRRPKFYGDRTAKVWDRLSEEARFKIMEFLESHHLTAIYISKGVTAQEIENFVKAGDLNRLFSNTILSVRIHDGGETLDFFQRFWDFNANREMSLPELEQLAGYTLAQAKGWLEMHPDEKLDRELNVMEHIFVNMHTPGALKRVIAFGQRINSDGDAAMRNSYASRQDINGGINLNARNMGLEVDKTKAMTVPFDPAMLAEFQKGNFTGLEAVILGIVPISSPL